MGGAKDGDGSGENKAVMKEKGGKCRGWGERRENQKLERKQGKTQKVFCKNGTPSQKEKGNMRHSDTPSHLYPTRLRPDSLISAATLAPIGDPWLYNTIIEHNVNGKWRIMWWERLYR